mgnify:CR=1 FL=1
MKSHLTPSTRCYTKAGPLIVSATIGGDFEPDIPPWEYEYGWKPIQLVIREQADVIRVSLTSMTLEELEALQRALNLAIDDAKAASKDMDDKAYQSLMQGDLEVPVRALASAPPFFERPLDPKFS